MNIVKIVMICPHPDDGEWSAGGTICKWGQKGIEVTMLVITHSNNPEQRKIREEESGQQQRFSNII